MAQLFCTKTRIFKLAVSLGGVESLIELPAGMTHANITEAQKEDAALSDDLIRLSCGIDGPKALNGGQFYGCGVLKHHDISEAGSGS